MSDNIQYACEVLQTQYEFALNQKFTDFKLRAGGKTVHCHRSVIAAKSEYFQVICDSGSTEAALDYTVTKEEDRNILDSMVKYLYLGQADITKQTVVSLVLAADFIRHNELKKQCEEYMISNISVQNLMAYQQLSEKTHLAKLNDTCQQFSLDNFSLVIPTEWYLSLSIKEVEEYLSDDALNAVSEDDVLDAILKWLQASRASQKIKEDYLEVLMPCIRLQFCTRSKLEALSKDPYVIDKLRIRIFEYLHHAVHTGQRARKSGVHFTGPKGTSTSSLGAKSATLATASGTTVALSARAPPAPTSASNVERRTASDRAVPGLQTSLADQGEEKLLILGGYTTIQTPHRGIVYLDKEPQGSVITQTPLHFFSACASEDSDSLILSGGWNFASNTSVPHVIKFSLTTKTWTDLPDMEHPVDRHGSTVIDNKLYTIGGRYTEEGDAKHRYASVNGLDLHTLMWSACSPMHEAVSAPGIASINRDIFVMAGDTSYGGSSKVHKFNTQTGKWSKCQDLPKADYIHHSTVVVQRSVFVLHKEAFLQYDVDVDQWNELTKPTKLSHAPAMVLKQGCLLALGGFGKWNTEPNDFIQLYDLASKKWTIEKKKMSLPLMWHWAVVVK